MERTLIWVRFYKRVNVCRVPISLSVKAVVVTITNILKVSTFRDLFILNCAAFAQGVCLCATHFVSLLGTDNCNIPLIKWKWLSLFITRNTELVSSRFSQAWLMPQGSHYSQAFPACMVQPCFALPKKHHTTQEHVFGKQLTSSHSMKKFNNLLSRCPVSILAIS